MPGALPAARPIFYDAETANGVVALATLQKRLIQWCRWTYGRDLYYLPSDPAPFRRDHNGFNQPDFGTGTGHLGSFYVPVPTAPATRLKMHVYVVLPVNTGWTDLTFTSSSGQVAKVRVDYAALGNVLEGWYAFDLVARPDCTIAVTSECSGVNVNVKSLCGWWEPLQAGSGLTLPGGALSFPSRTWCRQDGPDASYFVRALARLCNRYGATRPRMVVAKYYGNTLNRQTIGGGGAIAVVGRYRILVAENVTSLTVDLDAYSWNCTYSVDAYVDGVLAGGGLSAADNFNTLSVPIAKGAARFVELRLDAVVPATPGVLSVLGVHVREAQLQVADLGLAAGDTILGAFPAMAPLLVQGESAILANGQTGLAGVLDALVFLYANRCRVLVSDCRAPSDTEYGVGSLAGWNDGLNQGFPAGWFETTPGNGSYSVFTFEACKATIRAALRAITPATSGTEGRGTIERRQLNAAGSAIESSDASGQFVTTDAPTGITMDAPGGKGQWLQYQSPGTTAAGKRLSVHLRNDLIATPSPPFNFNSEWLGSAIETFIDDVP